MIALMTVSFDKAYTQKALEDIMEHKNLLNL